MMNILKFKTMFRTSIISLTTFCLFLMVLLSPSDKVYGSAVQDDFIHLYDQAGLLSNEEKLSIEEMCADTSKDAGIEIIILTHDDPKAKDGEIYIENFYDQYMFEYNPDSVILLIDMYSRDVIIHGYGIGNTYIHSVRGDSIITAISPLLSSEDYYDAFSTYTDLVVDYMNDDSYLNYNHDYDTYPVDQDYTSSLSPDNMLLNPWVQLVAALFIGGISVGIMAHNSGGKMTTGGSTYLSPNRQGLIGKRDIYMRTSVTKVKKPEPNQNSGSGGSFKGGKSSGGHSHSSSRGKF